jgi:hypothetical protein
MRQTTSDTLVQRMIGAAKLDPATYEDVERDVNATVSALLVVVIAAVASGLAGLGANGGLSGLIGGILAAIVSWVVYAIVVYFIGTTILKTAETRSTVGELLRTLGFAQSPQVLLVLGVVPILGALVGLVVGIWLILTTIVAIRQALDFTSTARAVVVAIVAGLCYLIVYGLIASLFFL